MLRALCLLPIGLLPLAGCTTIGFANTGATPVTTGDGSLTGNWHFALNAQTGTPPFASLDGALSQQGKNNTGLSPLLALLQASGVSSCFTGNSLVPFQGNDQASAVTLDSFTLNGQYVNLMATSDSTNTMLSGTYVSQSGCNGNGGGSITGTKYAPLTGTYTGTAGTSSSPVSLQLVLTQIDQMNGDGSIPLSGTANFSGESCFATGTVPSATAFVRGNVVQLTVATNEAAGSSVRFTGTFDQTADSIDFTSVITTGGACSGSLGSAALVRS